MIAIAIGSDHDGFDGFDIRVDQAIRRIDRLDNETAPEVGAKGGMIS